MASLTATFSRAVATAFRSEAAGSEEVVSRAQTKLTHQALSSLNSCRGIPVRSAECQSLGCRGKIQQRRIHAASSVSTTPPSVSSPSEGEGEIYEAEVERPFGLKFYKGEDGAPYIDAISAGSSAERAGAFEVGDKILAASAVFGDDIWDAGEYGRFQYTVANRIGLLTLRCQKKYGVKTAPWTNKGEFGDERRAGNIGDAVRERQVQNWQKRVEMREQRKEELEAGLQLYKEGKFPEALVKFETILELLPEGKEGGVACYNIACCYSKLGQVELGLSALEDALKAGFEDYKTIRMDPDLVAVRGAESFQEVLERYDEPFINENAIKAITSLFGLFGGKK
eukprot:TRINITY_DN543_c0_g1_i1.p1 TRINITY_DN543_c0_g1~~TRINITY_DN543_c0_g1_i1.p1  ORF type:complete len:340 (-),score=89.62 TRINITY_DN543_c0_g1_i1:213-1232(-)